MNNNKLFKQPLKIIKNDIKKQIRFTCQHDNFLMVTAGNILTAYAIDSGLELWRYVADNNIEDLYCNEKQIEICSESTDSRLSVMCSLDRTTGSLICKSTEACEGSIVSTFPDCFIFYSFAPDVKLIKCFSAGKHHLLWERSYPLSNLIMCAIGTKFVTMDYDGIVIVYDVVNGDMSWQLDIKSIDIDIDIDVFVHRVDNGLLINNVQKIIYLDVENEVVKWEYSFLEEQGELVFVGEYRNFVIFYHPSSIQYRRILLVDRDTGELIDAFDMEYWFNDLSIDGRIRLLGDRLIVSKYDRLLCYDLTLHKMIVRCADNTETLFAVGGHCYKDYAFFISNDEHSLHQFELGGSFLDLNVSHDEKLLRASFSNEEWQYLRQTPLVLMAPLADLDWGDAKKMLAVVSSHIQVIAEQGNLLVSTTFNDLLEELELLSAKWSRTPPDDAHQLAWTCTLLAMHQDHALATGYKQAIYQLAENFACSPRGEAPLALSEIPPLKQQMLASYRQILLG